MITLNTDTLRYITALQNASGVQVKDCIVADNEIIFIVDEESLGQAIGKGGQHANKIKLALGKQVRIIGYNSDPVKFTMNMLRPVEPKSIILDDNGTEKHIIIESDYKSHGLIRGKHDKKFKIYQDLLKRHHNVEGIILK